MLMSVTVVMIVIIVMVVMDVIIVIIVIIVGCDDCEVMIDCFMVACFDNCIKVVSHPDFENFS